MPAVVTKRLYMIFGLDNGKNLSVSLLDPKDSLTRAQIEPVMQMMVDNSVFVYNGSPAVNLVDAYIREVSTTDLM